MKLRSLCLAWSGVQGSTVLCGTPIKIIVSDLVGIRAHCGVARNSPNITITISGANNDVKTRAFKTSAPIGKRDNRLTSQSFGPSHALPAHGLLRPFFFRLLFSAMSSSLLCVCVAGDGCRAQSYCNGHGTCDLCTSTCVCDEGYGAPDDLIADIIAVRGHRSWHMLTYQKPHT
jgi:hypothetical protein